MMSELKRSISSALIGGFVILLLGFAPQVSYADALVALNLSQEGIAVKGYDVVSYHIEPEPQKGSRAHAHTYEGATYLFSSAENLQTFKDNPDKYIPAYGGFCSYGVVLGKKFDISPDAYRVVNGKLFLELDKGTRLVWEQDRDKNIEIGYRNWSSIKNVPANDL